MRGLNGSDVWVDQDGLDARLLERLDGLRAGVVEFTGLADGETTGADEDDLLYVRALDLGQVLAPFLETRGGGLDVLDGGASYGAGRRLLEERRGGESRTEDLAAGSSKALAIQRRGGGVAVKIASSGGQLRGGSHLQRGRVGASRKGTDASVHAGPGPDRDQEEQDE